MRRLFAVIASLAVFCTIIAGAEINEEKCHVCLRLIDEMKRNITSIDTNKVIGVGGFRLDASGNYNEKKIPYTKSEIYLTELMDEICEKMTDYVRATYKKSKRPTVLPLIIDGKMNPVVKRVDLVTDGDFNKSLKFYCESIMQDEEDLLMNIFQESPESVDGNLCVKMTNVCSEDILKMIEEAREEEIGAENESFPDPDNSSEEDDMPPGMKKGMSTDEWDKFADKEFAKDDLDDKDDFEDRDDFEDIEDRDDSDDKNEL